MTENRIDKGAFRNLAIYQRMESSGPVYSIVFKNPEMPKGWRHVLACTGWFVLFIGGGPLIWITGNNWVVVPWLTALVVIFNLIKVPWIETRTIELEYENDRLRVFKNGRLEIERPALQLNDVTVKEHPEAEYKRMRRQERGEKRLRWEEKQHCLFGWFGPGGAEQVVLVSRVEWPCRNSLMEVQAAIYWVDKHASGQHAEETEPEPVRPKLRAQAHGGGGIKPPLD